MSILYYPDSLVKKIKSPVERQQSNPPFQVVAGGADLTAADATYTFSQPADCNIHDVSLYFSNANAKDYAISKAFGKGVVTGLNDVLWFKADGAPEQKIVLDQGFYDGDELAAELKSQLDSNTAFDNASMTPFTVTYTAITGIFAITPSAGSIQYFNVNTSIAPFYKNSTAGPLFGLTADVALAASISSDTAVWGLKTVVAVVSDTSSTDQNIVSTEVWALDVDSGLRITASTVATLLNYKIIYKLV